MTRFTLAAALLVSTALAGGGPRVATTVLLDGASCQPYIGQVTFGVMPNPAASQRMAQIVEADQAARRVAPEQIDWNVVAQQDEARRTQTLALLRAGRLSSAQDYFSAGLVFQHGNCPQHYRLANLLAGQALARGGVPAAGWLYAATHDRWQMSLGKLQTYGTRFVGGDAPCMWALAPVDGATSDAERERLGVQALGFARAQADLMNAECRRGQP